MAFSAGPRNMRSTIALRAVALVYISMLLLIPVAMIAWRTFAHGLGPVLDAIKQPDALHALWLTLIAALIAVPANTIFGVLCALLLVRHEFPGKSLLSTLVDLPFAVSPVIIGLALILVYGHTGWLGTWLQAHGFRIIFAFPGIVLATIFASLPFVVREVVPVLREIGADQERAATTLGASPFQTFLRITLPSIRWGVAYGIVLTTARALGEFGAVSVVSSKVAGSTLTLPLLVEQRYSQIGEDGLRGAYAAATLLALMSLVVLLAMTVIGPRRRESR